MSIQPQRYETNDEFDSFPVSHMELGRQEPFLFSDRRREAVTNSNVIFFNAPGPTLEDLAALMEQLEPMPALPPFVEPAFVTIHKPAACGKTEMMVAGLRFSSPCL